MEEEVPTEPNLHPDVSQTPEDGKPPSALLDDEDDFSHTPPRILDSSGEGVDTSDRAVDDITPPTSSEPLDSTITSPPLEREPRRPSLESVWVSLQEKGSLSTPTEPVPLPEPEPEPEPEREPVVVQPQQQQHAVVPETEAPARVRPSSLRTRPRTGAKRSVTFKEDVEKREDKDVSKRDRRTTVPPGCLGLCLAVALSVLIVYLASPNVPTKPRLWTSAELEKFNGTNNQPPLLLGVLGSVFDVSKGWKHYGPGGSYHHFVGRDASRAFVSGNFTDDGLTDSLEGLTPSQIKAIDEWRLFFASRYVYLGKLVGTYYNKEGLPTKMSYFVEKKIKQASNFEKEQKENEERFPNCNSRWTQNQGGEVWCNDGRIPRIVELVSDGPRRGPPATRCACLEKDELHLPGLKGYEGCDAEASRCKT